MISRNEIRNRARAFSKEWERDFNEDAEAKSFWDTTALYISRPLVMVLSLCLILAINLVVIIQNKSSTNNVVAPHTLNVLADEDGYSTTFVTIETIENP